MKPKPPFMPGLPVLGNALDFARDRIALIKSGYEKIGPVFGIRLGPKPVVVLIGPDHQQFFFMETDKKLSINKPYEALKAIMGEVAFLASPEVYYEQRPILHSPFQREKMIKYLTIMHQEVQNWLDELGFEGEIDISKEMGGLVQLVAGHALMGKDFQNKVGQEFWDQYAVLGRSLNPLIPPYWPLPQNFRRERAKARMSQIFEPVIAERRRNPEAYDDFLQDFIETKSKSGGKADDETITSLLRALMFASHETTAGQAAWTIIELLRNPSYLRLVHKEIEQNLPYGKVIDGNSLRSLEHIALAVKEIERMHPSTDILMRVTEEPIQINGYHIPKDWMLMVSPAVAHRLPELFQEPDCFDPLRFSPSRQEDKGHRFALVGFGGGVHKCAGMNFANNEMMTITALFFQQFDLELVTQDPGVNYGMGAVRPEETIIRYRRKPIPN